MIFDLLLHSAFVADESWGFMLEQARLVFIIYGFLAAGNTPYGKRHTSRTISVAPLQVNVEEA